MSVVSLKPSALFTALALITLLAGPGELRAQGRLDVHPSVSTDFHSIKMVDVFNLFPNVGALITLAEPNDAGLPPGILGQCTGTLIHERVVLIAGHCTAPAVGGLPPFIKTIHDIQSECVGSLDVASGNEVRHPSFAAAVPATGPLHVRGASAGHP